MEQIQFHICYLYPIAHLQQAYKALDMLPITVKRKTSEIAMQAAADKASTAALPPQPASSPLEGPATKGSSQVNMCVSGMPPQSGRVSTEEIQRTSSAGNNQLEISAPPQMARLAVARVSLAGDRKRGGVTPTRENGEVLIGAHEGGLIMLPSPFAAFAGTAVESMRGGRHSSSEVPREVSEHSVKNARRKSSTGFFGLSTPSMFNLTARGLESTVRSSGWEAIDIMLNQNEVVPN